MATAAKPLLVVDVDTGVDDAHALTLAAMSASVEVLAVTCVSGNVGLPAVCNNTLRVLQVCQKSKVSVFPGCVEPLVAEGLAASHYHGHDGLGGVTWPDEVDRSMLQSEHASNALVRLARHRPGEITLVALAPLTNLAVAMRLDPDFTSNLKALCIMGGNIEGRGNNKTNVCAEFNFGADPEAARVVLAGVRCPTRLVSWETCLAHLVDWDVYEKWTTQDTDTSRFKRKITEKIKEIQKKQNSPGFRSCDLVAMATVVAPECVLEEQSVYVTVELQGQLTRGQMVVDWRGWLGRQPNVALVTKLDMGRLHALLMAMHQ